MLQGPPADGGRGVEVGHEQRDLHRQVSPARVLHLEVGDDPTSADVHQLRHVVPGVEPPQTALQVEVLVQRDGFVLPHAVVELEREIEPRPIRKRFRNLSAEKSFIDERFAFSCRYHVGADVLLSVHGFGQQEAEVVNRERRYQREEPVVVRDLHGDVDRVGMIPVRGTDVLQTGQKRLGVVTRQPGFVELRSVANPVVVADGHRSTLERDAGVAVVVEGLRDAAHAEVRPEVDAVEHLPVDAREQRAVRDLDERGQGSIVGIIVIGRCSHLPGVQHAQLVDARLVAQGVRLRVHRRMYVTRLKKQKSKMVTKMEITKGSRETEREMFYLTTHSTHFIYGYMASDIW